MVDLEGDAYDSDDEFVDVGNVRGGEEEVEVEAKSGEVFGMLPACARIPACTATPVQRRFVLDGPGFPAMPFSADSLPPSAAVAKSMPPEAELGRTLHQETCRTKRKG